MENFDLFSLFLGFIVGNLFFGLVIMTVLDVVSQKEGKKKDKEIEELKKEFDKYKGTVNDALRVEKVLMDVKKELMKACSRPHRNMEPKD